MHFCFVFFVSIYRINCNDVCVVLMSTVNGRDDGEHVATLRYVQHKPVSQSGASSGHEVRCSAAAATSRPTGGKSHVEVSSVAVGPASSSASPLSYVETPRDAVMTLQLLSVQHNKQLSEQSVSVTSSKPSSETADTSGPSRTGRDDMSRVSGTSHNSNVQLSVKASATQESTRFATSSQSGSHDKPKTSRLAVYNTFSYIYRICSRLKTPM